MEFSTDLFFGISVDCGMLINSSFTCFSPCVYVVEPL